MLDISRNEEILRQAVRIALGDKAPDAFFEWMRNDGVQTLIDGGFCPVFPRSDWSMLGTQLGRHIWNHLPRPDNDFKPIKLPEPGRNDPCPCGSGRKYKRCCGMGVRVTANLSEDLFLPLV